PIGGKPIDIDPGLHARDIDKLNELIKRPITKGRLDEWAGDAYHRGVLLEDSVWGVIRWSRRVGRPLGPTFAGALTIQRPAYASKFEVVQGGGIRDVGTWEPLPAPASWDGPHDDENYRVSFLCRGIRLWQNHIWVTFSGVPWDLPPYIFAGHRRIQPLGDYFQT